MSNWLGEHLLVLSFLAAYGALLVWHAVEGRRETRGLADYYVGGRAMGGVILGLSFFATFASTNTFVGLSGQSYTFGAPWLLYIPAFIGFGFVSWLYVAPRFRLLTEQLNSITVADFVGARYASAPARLTAAAIIVVASLFYMTAIYKGSGHILSALLDVPYSTGILIVLIVTMSYTMVGGFKSVVRTDAVQGLIMLLAAVILLSYLLPALAARQSFGDLRVILETKGLLQWNTAISFPLLIGIITATSFKLLIEPRQLSRFYSLKDARARRQGMWITAFGFLIIFSLLLPVGMLAHGFQLGSVTDTDLVMPTLLEQPFIPPWVAALVLVAIAAAAMSSLDSVLLVVAGICHNDLTAPYLRRAAANGITGTRVYIALLSLATAAVALDPPGGIVMLTALSGSLYAACLGPAVLGGLWWQRGNGIAVVVSALVGLIILVLWRELRPFPNVHEVFPAGVLSSLSYVVCCLSLPAASPRPMPAAPSR